jgi:hypothetical protein
MPAFYTDSLLLMDLTARRTDWGPAFGGGDGVVVHTTLPDISYAFGNAEEKRAGRCLVQQGWRCCDGCQRLTRTACC